MATRTIWKYELEIVDEQVIKVPRGAKFLSVAEQGGKLCLWAEVNPAEAAVGRGVTIVGTGNPLFDGVGSFVGTVVMPPFVWHVYVK